MNYFRQPFAGFISFNPKTGILLILIFGAIRFLLVLGAAKTGNYSLVSVVFLMMWITPFLLLNKAGRRLTGIRGSRSAGWLLLSFLFGIAACMAVFFIGWWLYGHQPENWFVYIAGTYNLPEEALAGQDKIVYFLIFAAIGMSFSPVGEELMYRGLIHQAFVPRFGENGASVIDSSAFALTHLAHFGVVFIGGTWQFLFIPALFWMILMYLSSRLFFLCKAKTGSILGAIISHTGFNLAMTWFIFYYIF